MSETAEAAPSEGTGLPSERDCGVYMPRNAFTSSVEVFIEADPQQRRLFVNATFFNGQAGLDCLVTMVQGAWSDGLTPVFVGNTRLLPEGK